MDLGLIVDVETTGLDAKEDEIIEMGLLEFSVSEGGIPEIVSLYGSLQEPQKKMISPEITKITGITKEMAQGKKIDWQLVRESMQKASVIIAHNMEFDRAFLLNVPFLKDVNAHWACSLKHIDWHSHGFKTKALNYLAADMGFVNPFSHRALFDCATTFRVVAPYLEELIRRSYEREYLISAIAAPFEQKDKLKERGYFWNPRESVWEKRLGESDLATEKAFLSENIYKGQPKYREICMP